MDETYDLSQIHHCNTSLLLLYIRKYKLQINVLWEVIGTDSAKPVYHIWLY